MILKSIKMFSLFDVRKQSIDLFIANFGYKVHKPIKLS